MLLGGEMAVQFNKPVYDFLGYKLIKVNFNRLNDGLFEIDIENFSNSPSFKRLKLTLISL